MAAIQVKLDRTLDYDMLTNESFTDYVLDMLLNNSNPLIDCSATATAGNRRLIDQYKVVKDIFSKSATIMQSKIRALEAIQQQDNQIKSESEDSLLEIKDMQCFEPRGRYTLKLTTTGIHLRKANNQIISIAWGDVDRIFVLNNDNVALKKEEDFFIFTVTKPQQMSGTTKMSNKFFFVSNKKENKVTINELLDVVKQQWKKTITVPDRMIFSSLVTNKSFLKCYNGINEGTLYPLTNGLLFLKPVLFIPADDIASLAAGRGGTTSTKYIDIQIELPNDKKIEFTNIEREELAPLQKFVQYILEARKKAEKKAIKEEKAIQAAKKESEESEGVNQTENLDNDDDDDESDDEDYILGEDEENSIDDDRSEVSGDEDNVSDDDEDDSDADDVENTHKSTSKKRKLSQSDSEAD